MAQRHSDQLANRKDLRVHQPRIIPGTRLSERVTTEQRVRDQAATPVHKFNMERLSRQEQLADRERTGTIAKVIPELIRFKPNSTKIIITYLHFLQKPSDVLARHPTRGRSTHLYTGPLNSSRKSNSNHKDYEPTGEPSSTDQ